jgi:uncharacterized membrane protein
VEAGATATPGTPEFGNLYDDKNIKAQMEEEGVPLHPSKRFKDLRFQVLITLIIMFGLAVLSVLIVMKRAPPDRIVLTVQTLAPFCFMGLFPFAAICTKYFKSDTVIMNMVYLIIISTLIVGYSFDFIVQHVMMKRAVYGSDSEE